MKMWYTDPFAALIMHREFGVRYDNPSTQSIVSIIKECLESGVFPDCRFYINPESMPIFEPQDEDMDTKGRIFMIGRWWAGGSIDPTAKIVMRNSKHFIMPETEGDLCHT